MAHGPVVRWKTNEGEDATPPADAKEWVEIIATVSPTLSVLLIWPDDGRNCWHVSRAAETLPETGGGPPKEIIRTDEVRQALEDEGMPVCQK